jgi:hypothetical protein
LSSSSNSNYNAAPWPEDVTGEAFARLVGLPDSRRARELVEAGIITRTGKDSYPVAGIALYCEHLRTSEKSEYQRRYEKNRADLYGERAREQKRRADLIDGTSFDAKAISAVIGAMLAASRTRILTIPSTTASAVAEVSDPESCRKILSDACRDALAEIASFNPDAIIQRFRDQTGQQAAPSTDSK